MVSLIISVVALTVSVLTLYFFGKRKPAPGTPLVFHQSSGVHSYWPCFRCGRPVPLHGEEHPDLPECDLCKLRNK